MSTEMAAVFGSRAGTIPCCRAELVALATTGPKEMLPVSISAGAFFMPKYRQFVAASSFGAVKCGKTNSMAHSRSECVHCGTYWAD